MRSRGLGVLALSVLCVSALAVAQEEPHAVPRYTESPAPTSSATAATTASPGATPRPGEHDVLIYNRPGPAAPHPRRTPVPPQARAQCSATIVDGSIEPTQGVWQDDPAFATKTPQLVRDTRRPIPTFRAGLDMVAGRPTVLSGVEFYFEDSPSGARHEIGDRDHLLLTIRTDCATKRRVKVAVDVVQHDSVAAKFESDPFPAELPIDPPRVADGRPRLVTISVPAFEGFPADRTFTLTPGPWQISMEVLKESNGARTGLRVEETGTAVATRAPSLAFVPVTFTPTQLNFARVSGEASFHADAVSKYLADFFPLAPGAIPAAVAPPTAFLSPSSLPAIGDGIPPADRLAAAIADRLQTAAYLTRTDRMIGVLDDDDWPSLFVDPVDATETPGVAALRRAALDRASESMLADAHELAHGLPTFDWTTAGMIAECGITTHDRDGLADGLRLSSAGNPVLTREWMQGAGGILSTPPPGPDVDPFAWVNKCEWSHLLGMREPPRQSRVKLVRGVIVRQDDGRLKGAFASFYDVDGTVDLEAAKPGATRAEDDWAINVLNAKGKLIATYPFTPVWRFEDDPQDRAVMPFAFRLPFHADAREYDLIAPNYAATDTSADKRKSTGAVPTIHISAPFPNASVKAHEGKIHVAWAGRGVNGGTPYYSILDSTDGGKTWLPVEIEVQQAQLDMPAVPGKHVLKLVISDGTASRETTVAFSVR